MVEPVAELNKHLSLQTPEILEIKISQLVLPSKTPLKISKQDIRSTLKASTIDGVFAAVFESATTGLLLSNFLLQVGASSVEIGILSAIPMLVNFLQPLFWPLGRFIRSGIRAIFGGLNAAIACLLSPFGCCAAAGFAAFDFGTRTAQCVAKVDRPHFWTFQIKPGLGNFRTNLPIENSEKATDC